VSVSVVIPCYNAERWIGKAIESCLAQSHAPDEVIVVDDGSTDDSSVIIARYASRVHHVRQDNAGAPRARNAGFALSRGEFIQFLDADDFLLPGKLEHQAAVLTKTRAAAVYGDWRQQFHERDGGVWLDEPNERYSPNPSLNRTNLSPRATGCNGRATIRIDFLKPQPSQARPRIEVFGP
jgi:glycosyltransferase involved in cell wall biosynthesis